MPTTVDKMTRESYWDKVWNIENIPSPVSLDDSSLDNFMALRLGRFFDKHIPAADSTAKKVLLEAGCGGSTWLPLFAGRYGYHVMGIDYSDKGCELSRAILAKADEEGRILRGDIFSPPDDLHEKADIVYSIGLAEHFTPTETIMRQLGWFVRPGGKVITIVPNMRGLQGVLQKVVDRKLYDAHVPLTPAELAQAHEMSGLNVLESSYLGTLSLGTVNAERWAGSWKYKVLQAITCRASAAVWRRERAGMPERKSLWFSPLVACVAQKPTEST